MDESDVTSKSTSDNENNFGLQKPKSRKRKSPNELIIDDIEIFEETRYESDEEESDEEDQLFQGSSSSDEDHNDNDENHNMCPICLGEFTDQMVGIPENCVHMFCIECIQEWTKNVNNCPVDRKKFNSISIMLTKDGPVIEEVYIEDKEMKESDFEDPPTYCQICGLCDREEALLLCDECDNGYHLDCLDPPLSVVPIDEWHCPECQPAATSRGSRRDRSRSSSGLIGNEDDLLNVFERVQEQQRLNPDTLARGLMFGQLARTVASTRGTRGRRRGRGRSRRRGGGRGQTSASQSSANRRRSGQNTSVTIKKRRRRKKKKARSSSKNKSPSEKVKRSLEKARKKHIKEQIEKFRANMQQRGSEPLETSQFSLFGSRYNLDAFHGDSEETYRLQERGNSPARSAIVNSTDVVGSILGGFGTLDPDNVIVHRNGSLEPKTQEVVGDTCEDSTKDVDDAKKDGNRKSSSSSISGVVKNNVKRRKIRFFDDDDECGPNAKENDNVFVVNKPDMKEGLQERSTSNSEGSQTISRERAEALKEKIRKGFKKRMKQKEEAEQLKQKLKNIRSNFSCTNHKTTANLHTISQFKIPKLKRENKEEKTEVSKKSPNVPKESKVGRPIGVSSDVTKRVTLDVSPRKPLSLEKKVQLYQDGKLQDKVKCIAKSSKPRLFKEIENPVKHPKPAVAKILTSATITKEVKPECSSTAIQKKLSRVDQKQLPKKPLSYEEYKNRKLYKELFGDADLECSLETIEAKHNKPVKLTESYNAKKSLSRTTKEVVGGSNKSVFFKHVNSISTSPKADVVAIENDHVEKLSTMKNRPVAVVSPSIRNNTRMPEFSKATATYSNVLKGFERQYTNIPKVLTIPTSAKCSFERPHSARNEILDELNELCAKKEQKAQSKSLQKSNTTEIKVKHLLCQAKQLLKPYYKLKTISKDEWKSILKKAHGKISAHVDHFYYHDGELKKLILEYLRLYET